jgi:hypothetical protein
MLRGEKTLIRQNLTAHSTQSVTATIHNRIAGRAAIRIWLTTDSFHLATAQTCLDFGDFDFRQQWVG